MTDFRRPDLDLWEEEEDGEDARPTIVSERPSAAHAGKPVKASDTTIPFGTIARERDTPEVQRSSLVQRLIEQGALEDEAGRTSVEELRDSDLDLLRLPAEPEPIAASEASAAPQAIGELETEPATEDQIPTVSVKRPLPAVPIALAKVAQASSAKAASFSEREITARFTHPSGMAGSIAPATRTFRPRARERKGLPIWQAALAAVVLLGGGISLAKFRAEQREQTAARPSQASAGQRAAQLPAAAQPLPSVVAPAAPEPSAATGPEPAPAPQDLEERNPATLGLPPGRPNEMAPAREGAPSDGLMPVSRTRRVRERTAIASPDAPNPEPVRSPAAVKPPVRASGALAPHPSRDQVASALDAVTGELKKCVGERHGVAEVTVTVRPAGFVSYAVVSGDYAGTMEGSCIARAVRSAKFPVFADPMLRVTYPFQL